MTRSEAKAPPTPRKAHRAGPVETDEVGRNVQRCLRCDSLLNVVTNREGGKEIRLGRRVFVGHSVCPGVIMGDDAES